LLRKQYFLTGVNFDKASLEAVLRLALKVFFIFFSAFCGKHCAKSARFLSKTPYFLTDFTCFFSALSFFISGLQDFWRTDKIAANSTQFNYSGCRD
jgi:hypothetical protein